MATRIFVASKPSSKLTRAAPLPSIARKNAAFAVCNALPTFRGTSFPQGCKSLTFKHFFR